MQLLQLYVDNKKALDNKLKIIKITKNQIKNLIKIQELWRS